MGRGNSHRNSRILYKHNSQQYMQAGQAFLADIEPIVRTLAHPNEWIHATKKTEKLQHESLNKAQYPLYYN